MEAIPLCDNIEVCVYIDLRLDTTIVHNNK